MFSSLLIDLARGCLLPPPSSINTVFWKIESDLRFIPRNEQFDYVFYRDHFTEHAWAIQYIRNKMAAIRHSLQQELFRPSEEALYSVVNVAKISGGKKKKTTFYVLQVYKISTGLITLF